MKVSELTGAQLDHWVARANGWTFGPPHKTLDCDIWRDSDGKFVGCAPASGFKPSSDWCYGGPIIESEHIRLEGGHNQWRSPSWLWTAWPDSTAVGAKANGRSDASPLVAAMRAYVASKYGDEVSD